VYEPHQQEPQHQGPVVTVPLAWLNEILEVYYAARADRLITPEQAQRRVEEVQPIMTEASLGPGGLELVPGFDRPGPGYTPRGVAGRGHPEPDRGDDK